jgi:hypothetical protein
MTTSPEDRTPTWKEQCGTHYLYAHGLFGIELKRSDIVRVNHWDARISIWGNDTSANDLRDFSADSVERARHIALNHTRDHVLKIKAKMAEAAEIAWLGLQETRQCLSPGDLRVFMQQEFRRRLEASKANMTTPRAPPYDDLYFAFVKTLSEEDDS